MAMMRHIVLNNGRYMPIFGLGTWKSEGNSVVDAVQEAIDVGYRHIDCAMIYGNEKEVGIAIKNKIDDGTIKREDLFVTSKLWNTFHSKNLVVPTLKKTLTDLQLDYVDLYLIHWPTGFKEGTDDFCPRSEDGKFLYSAVDYVDTWRGMEEAVSLGLAKSIGVSNFNKDQIERILAAASVPPANNQVECHPFLTQEKLFQYCKSKGISMTAYSPLGSPTRPWVSADEPIVLEDPKVAAIAKKYNKTVAQILIRFQVQRGIVCIPKSVTKSRIIENSQIWDFELSDADMNALLGLDCNVRYVHCNWDKEHPHYPFHTEF